MYCKIFVISFLLILGCGTPETDTCVAGPCYLAGDFTDEEARAVTVVTRAIVDAGYTEPGYAISFIHSPEATFKGTLWVDWRCGVEPRNPAEGYRGFCCRKWCMVFVRRFGEARPYLYELLVHELVHALGYDHGERMRAAEKEIWGHIK